MCPYYNNGYHTCNISGVYKDESDRRCWCLGNWRNCANYTNATLEQKIKDRKRDNPDL